MAIPNAPETKEGTPKIPEIVFFDLETTVPARTQQRFWVLEFGAMVLCPRKLVEVDSFCTLIRPDDLSVVPLRSSRQEGITRAAIKNAPRFEEVADRIFEILDGKVWAGHNIQRFDCVRIKELFSEHGRDAPKPVGMIDSLGVLTEKFGRRAGNMKMATLADYFGLGQQKHRSIDDVRMNLEVLKNCATVLFLESSLPNLLDGRWKHDSSGITTRSRSNALKLTIGSEVSSCSRKAGHSTNTPSSSAHQRFVPYSRTSCGKISMGVKSLMCKATEQSHPVISTLLKHSRSVLR